MAIKLVVGGFTLNIISAYALHAGLGVEDKVRFWEDLDELVRGIPDTEKLFIGGDFDGHIGSNLGRYDNVHGGFGFGNRNKAGVSLLDFASAFGLVIANSSFLKEEYLVTFRNAVARTRIDYLLLRKDDKGVCKDCEVISSESFTTQHKLLVMDLETKRKKRVADRPRIKWGNLTMASATRWGRS
ncbi:uncharacterized protein LOC132045710 [Lycium ferocissimum]|uniref:uncharacterized protein LOC132045710 n=1 Tax=Lycium ferocissimum TaxID=112874 RepID=UPI0028153004|nr:uncharacterized protein LOC132045710 [Lycium ferocissimum]